MKPITLTIRWHEMFGKQPADIPEKTRRQRWEEWKQLAADAGDQEMVDYWSKDNIDETCAGCINKDGDWCRWSGLPCNVNPILTFNDGIIGMACLGMGYQPHYVQQELFKDEQALDIERY